MTGEHPPRDGEPGRSGVPDSRAEQVLSQALRLMAGGAATERGRTDGSPAGAPRRITTGQLLLLAAIVGLLVGITVGLLSLL